MWFLYVNKVFISQFSDIVRLLELVQILMECSGIISIELKPELEF